MTKMTDAIRAKVGVLSQIHSEKVLFMEDFRKNQRELLRQKTANFEADASRVANEIRAMGGTHRVIQEQIGLYNWDSYKAFMAIGAPLLRSEEQIAQQIEDATPYEIVSSELGDNHSGPYVSFREKASGFEGNIWANNAGNYRFSFDGDSSKSREIKDWYKSVTGHGN